MAPLLPGLLGEDVSGLIELEDDWEEGADEAADRYERDLYR